jgi:tyramine---L-glutamate ligase
MRVFVYEHLCAQRDADSPLAAEGRAMLLAALADLCALEGVAVSTLVAPSVLPLIVSVSPRITTRSPRSPDAGRTDFVEAARGCDFALVIAPEPDDVLATRCEWALEAGCKLLGPSPEAVRLCADKLRLAEHLRKCEILTPATTLYDPDRAPADGYPHVIKPRSGAGAQATFVVASGEFSRAGEFARAQGYEGELIVQPYCHGRPGSVAVILAPDRPLALLPCEQRIETTSPSGQLRYAGGAVTYPIEWAIAAMLAQSAAWSVPGLGGYVGIDVIVDPLGWTNTAVIEINPRLTTSYVGLRRLSNVNLMRVLLDAAQGKETSSSLSWKTGRVRFDPDGTVYE